MLDLAKPAIASGDAVYVMSRGMQLSIADTAKLATVCKVTGIEINEVNSSMRRLSANLNKAGNKDNAAMRMLERFGAQVKDSNGNIKNEIELIDEVSRALLRAESVGMGAAFRDVVGGRFWSGDFVTFLEDYAGNVELAGKIVKNGLANPVLAHEVQGNLNAMNTQAAQLGGVFSSALMPVANEIIPRVTAQMGELTKVIAENKDGIKATGQVIAEVVGSIGEATAKVTTGIIKVTGALSESLMDLKKIKDSPVNDEIVSLYLNDENVKSLDDLLEKELKRNSNPVEIDLIKASPTSPNFLRERLRPTYEELDRLRQESKKTAEEVKESMNSIAEAFTLGQERKLIEADPSILENFRKARKYLEEADNIIFGLNHSDYEKQIRDVDNWRNSLLRETEVSAEQHAAIEELYAAKAEQIEQEKEDKLNEIREQAERARHTDLENTLADIEKEKEKRINAGMEAAEAIRMAAEESAAAIKNLEDAFTEKINSFRNNALQNQFAAIDKDRDSWVEKGIDPEQANAFADEQKYKALQDLEESFSQRINEIRGNDLEKQLARIEQEKQAWIDKGIEETRAEELAASQKEQVFKDYAEKQQQAQERYEEQVEQREEQIAKAIEDYWKRVAESIERQFDEALSVLKSQLDAFKAYRDGGIKGLEEYERKQLKKQGITDKDLQSMTKDNLEDFKQAQKDVKRNLLPNFQPVNDVPFPELPPQIEPPEAFDDLNEKLYQTTDALDLFKNALSLNSTAPNYAEDADGNRYDLDDIHNTPNYTPQYDSSDFNTDLNQSVTDALSRLGDTFTPINDELSQITQSLSDIMSEVKNTVINSNNQSQPANIDVTVQIDEAHAWDYDHIQELAELVAARIQPVIVSAIGGDSNGY